MCTTTFLRSPTDVRRELKRLGFFHATGLPWLSATDIEDDGHIQAYRQHLGSWGSDGHWVVAVLENGEVWLMRGEPDDDCRKLMRKICPRGRGAAIPCDNGRILDADHVAERFRDPYGFCNGHADPSPKPI